MRAPRVYVAPVLISIFILLSVGYAQTGNARPGPEAINRQSSNPMPSNSGAPGTLPNSTNNPGQPAPGKISNGPSPVQKRATPANAPASVQNSPLATAAPQSQAAIPQHVLFQFLFDNISALDQAADSDDKAGNHQGAALWRTHDQRGAGLNDAEGQILQEIALDCLRQLKEKDEKIRVLAERDRAQMPPGTVIPASPEMIQTFEERKKVVSDHIERLREALGDASFNKLDTYVHSSFHAEVIAPKSATPSTAIIEKNQKESK